MKPVQAGQLRHRIIVDEPMTTQDGTGDPVTTWVTRSVVWGKIEPLRGREATAAGMILSDMDTRITVRPIPAIAAISPKWRLRYQMVIYNIVSVADVEMQGRLFEIMCKSGRNLG